MVVILGGYRLLKRPLSSHCAEILAVFQARMGTVASGFAYKVYCPAVNSMGMGQETSRSYCANKEDSRGEQSLTTQRKGWEEFSAHPQHRRQNLSLRILKAKGLGRAEA